MGIIGNALFLATILIHSEDWRHSPSCATNLKFLRLYSEAYARDHQGLYPELSPKGGRLMFRTEQFFPEYFSDTRWLVCPSDELEMHRAKVKSSRDPASVVDDQSYFYLGYLVRNDAEMRAFAAAYKQRIDAGLSFDEDLEVPEGETSAGVNTLVRLRQNLGQTLPVPSADAEEVERVEAEIPVMWERATLAPGEIMPSHWHPIGKMKVIFMDGHVETVGPGQWPHTEETMRLLHELDTLLQVFDDARS